MFSAKRILALRCHPMKSVAIFISVPNTICGGDGLEGQNLDSCYNVQFPTYLKCWDIVFRSSFHPAVLTQVEAVHFDLLPFIWVNLLNTRTNHLVVFIYLNHRLSTILFKPIESHCRSRKWHIVSHRKLKTLLVEDMRGGYLISKEAFSWLAGH